MQIRKALLPLAIALAMVMLVVPTYSMVGCEMDMGAMRFLPMRGVHFTAPCPGSWVLSSAPAATVPAGGTPFLLSIIAAFAASVLLLAPQIEARPVLVRVSNPPPPPEDPLGKRFRI